MTWSEIEGIVVILLTDYAVKMTSLCICYIHMPRLNLILVREDFFSFPVDISQYKDLHVVRMLEINGCGYSSLNRSITKMK